jgi:hypothetical protein
MLLLLLHMNSYFSNTGALDSSSGRRASTSKQLLTANGPHSPNGSTTSGATSAVTSAAASATKFVVEQCCDELSGGSSGADGNSSSGIWREVWRGTAGEAQVTVLCQLLNIV